MRAARRNANLSQQEAEATAAAGSEGDETLSESQKLVPLEEVERVYKELGL